MDVRSLTIEPQSFDAEARTFEAIATTGADVRRTDSAGPFTERLDLSAVPVEALVGLPVLDGHRQGGSEHAIGTVLSAKRVANGIAVVIKLSAADDVRDIVTKVSEGVLRGVSIGYTAASRTETKVRGERIITIAPRIHEVSVVAIPADPAATIRNKENPMPNPANDDVVERRQQIRAIARGAGLSPEWADTQIDSDADLVAVRAAAFDEIQSRQKAAPVIRTQAPANDDPNVIAERRADALYARVAGVAPADEARQYFNDGLVDHARAFLTQRGISTAGQDKETILRAAMHTTSDFPNLLTSTGNRILLPSYEANQSVLKTVARQALMSDFRAGTRLKLGELGTLSKVNEAGEIRATSRGEAAESYALDTYASLMSLSRKAMINDDLGAFADWGRAAGRAAAETESQLLWNLLSQASGAGPTMGEDGKRMFHADHGNIGAVSPLTIEGLSAARVAMRTMKGLDGKTSIAVTPRYLLVGPALETSAETMLANLTPAKTGDVNPFSGKLELLVEPRLSGNGWYVFADPAQLACLEYAYLASAQGPQMASREGWDVLGMEFRVTLDFGAGAVDWRGAYRNPGA